MQYVYILKSNKDGNLYTGCTNNVKQRLALHNAGKIFSTKLRKPFKLIFYEAFISKQDAFKREKWLKTGWGRNQISTMLSNSLKV